jgi:hypothetical protein
MADDTSPKSEAEIVAPVAVPPNREPRHDPGVIDGEATEIHAPSSTEEIAGEEAPAEAAEEPTASEAEPVGVDEAPKVLPPRRGRGGAIVAGALAAFVGAAVALGAAWYLDPRAAALDAAATRLAALNHEAETQSQTNADFAKRLGALETAEAGAAKAAALEMLDKRVATLEGGGAKDDSAQAALTEARAARADAAKALALASAAPKPAVAPTPGGAPAAPDAGVIEARLSAIEAALAGQKADEGDLATLKDRLAKAESALAAPKSEARVAAAAVAENRDGAAEAILAISLNERLIAGAPFAGEWGALTRRGADAAKLAALKPFADSGAPTVAALATGFAKLAPNLVAAATPPAEGGVVDRMLDHMRSLVRVRKVGEAAGDSADAVVARVSAALAHGDLAAALDAYRHLPDAARQASADWGKAAEARLAAAAAAQGLRAEAIGRLVAAKD